MQKHINVDILPPAIVHPNEGIYDAEGRRLPYYRVNDDVSRLSANFLLFKFNLITIYV